MTHYGRMPLNLTHQYSRRINSMFVIKDGKAQDVPEPETLDAFRVRECARVKALIMTDCLKRMQDCVDGLCFARASKAAFERGKPVAFRARASVDFGVATEWGIEYF